MSRIGRLGLLVVLVACASGVLGRAVHADTAVLPDDGSLPWTNPVHASPLEVLASAVATQIARRPVSVQCEGANDWAALAAQDGFDPSVELGFVPFSFYVASRTIAAGGDVAYLSPGTCWTLEQFGLAAVKPVSCPSLEAAALRGASACAGADAADAEALWTLAHESIHLLQDTPGAPVDAILPAAETDANCFGLQWLPAVAEQFGATPDEGEALAEYAYTNLYPAYQGLGFDGSPYWSADCRPDGPLDLTPGDGVWP